MQRQRRGGSVTSNSTPRRYLLGQLDEEQADAFEELLLANEQAQEALSVAEEELIESYADGTLSDEERRAFELNLGDAERMTDVRVTRFLMRAAAGVGGRRSARTPLVDIASRRRPSGGERTRQWGLPSSWWNLAAAAGVLLATGVATAWLTSALMRSRAATEQGRLAQQLDEAESKIAALMQEAGPVFELSVGTRGPGGGTTTVQIQRDSAIVRLGIRVPAGAQYLAYRIQLRRQLDSPMPDVWSSDVAATDVGGGLAVVHVPVALLVNDYYIAELRGIDAQSISPPLAEIPFQVRR
jgi:hypothetical protein